jgi:hypothetical protein
MTPRLTVILTRNIIYISVDLIVALNGIRKNFMNNKYIEEKSYLISSYNNYSPDDFREIANKMEAGGIAYLELYATIDEDRGASLEVYASRLKTKEEIRKEKLQKEFREKQIRDQELKRLAELKVKYETTPTTQN